MKYKKNDFVKKSFCLLVSIVIFFGCTREQKDPFYRGFVDPPAESRPFFRWYWSGNHIEADEIKRELDSMKSAGIGGIEIFPVAMPEDARDIGTEPLIWLSEEWNELLALTCKEAHERNMIADMLIGSGWPFGGEFIQEDEAVQRVSVNRIPVEGPVTVELNFKILLDKMLQKSSDVSPYVYRDFRHAESNELFFISLVPFHAADESEAVDLMDHYNNKTLKYSVDRGRYELVYGILQKGHKKVMRGAPGASGNVMDHYSKKVVMEYLNRLKRISEDTGIPLSKLLRALFCDSIELSGANWTGRFLKMFKDAYGYSLEPYLPFVFYLSYEGYQENEYGPEFREELKRVRYDYNSLLVKVYLDNFVRTLQDFCTENGVKCKYQAYGTPFLMGMLEGYMIPDIPEGNNWVYQPEGATRWQWSKGHGYMIWNHYTASGGHLKGRKIISNESMTGGDFFRTHLQELKQHDDMNFISGMTHSVWNSFNYSPPGAGFPGWLWVGTWFSPMNTWWPYLHHWADYNARLSYVFQNSEPAKSVAVLGPTGDIWSNVGLTRGYFHTHPWYLYQLWETLSQNGSSCEYLNQQVIAEAESADGKLVYGPMQYNALWLADVQSLHPETAKAIQRYVESGGTLVMINSVPDRSLSMINADANDSTVRSVFDDLRSEYPDRVFLVKSPEEQNRLMEWTGDKLDQTGISRDVTISGPDPALYQIRHKKGEREIYFFTNVWNKKTLEFTAVFPVGDKIPYVWDPQTGEKHMYPYSGESNRVQVTLNPSESLLLVFEPDGKKEPVLQIVSPDTTDYLELDNPWKLTLEHFNGEVCERTFTDLKEFTSTGDPVLKSFAGKVVYETVFDGDEKHTVLGLNDINKGITEVYVNGKKAGVMWYGNHPYDLEPYLNPGENKLKIIYTTVLANHCIHLKDNSLAQRIAARYSPVPTGITGPVRLYAKK